MPLPLATDPAFASLTNDTGTGQDGTVVNEALFDAIAAAIDDVLVIPGEPDSPSDIGAEVIAARGNEASLDARISGVIDANGNFLGSTNSNVDITGEAGANIGDRELAVMLTDGRFYRMQDTQDPRGVVYACIGGITTGGTTLFRRLGTVDGLSGLVAGTQYFQSATDGVLGIRPSGEGIIVGVARDAENLVLTPEYSNAAAVLQGVNLVRDATYLFWAAGDALAPTHYTLGGAGAAVARCGTALADTNRKVGAFCARLTAAAAEATLLQTLLGTASMDSYFQLRYVSLGAWVKCSTTSAAKVVIRDGIVDYESVAHSGGGGWEWLTVTGWISGAATKIEVGLLVDVNLAVAYISGTTAIFGRLPPMGVLFSPCSIGTIWWKTPGSLTGLGGTTQRDTYLAARPAMIKHVELHCKTAPTGQALKVDINTWDGAALLTAFTTKPEIAAAAFYGGQIPDGTYARKFVVASMGATGYPTQAGLVLTWDLDQVGSGVAGSDLSLMIRMLQFTSPLDVFLGISEVS